MVDCWRNADLKTVESLAFRHHHQSQHLKKSRLPPTASLILPNRHNSFYTTTLDFLACGIKHALILDETVQNLEIIKHKLYKNIAKSFILIKKEICNTENFQLKIRRNNECSCAIPPWIKN